MFYSEEEYSRILESVSKLDELSLYLEICKYEEILNQLKHNALITPGKISFQSSLIQAKEILDIHLEQLENFGIPFKNKDAVLSWKHACSQFLNGLDMVEYALFMQTRMSGNRLDMFCCKGALQSSFWNPENQENCKKNAKAMKIS